MLPPHVIYRTGKVDEAGFRQASKALGQRLDAFWTTAPIAFRRQNAGDYDIPALTLRPDIAPGQHGFAIHLAQA